MIETNRYPSDHLSRNYDLGDETKVVCMALTTEERRSKAYTDREEDD